jgi:hypothetical protein
MFEDARSLPYIRAPEWGFTLIGFLLIRKHYKQLERPARDKHSSLFGPFESYEEKKVIRHTGNCTQHFIFVMGPIS